MMLPIGLAILSREQEMGSENANFASALMLCIAYSASIGGTGTLVGTPPNLLFVSTMRELFPESPDINFIDWLKIGIPFVVFYSCSLDLPGEVFLMLVETYMDHPIL